MAKREFWLNDEVNGIYMRLPVTPSEFIVSLGNKIETVNVTEVGDVNIAGTGNLMSIQLSSFFPNRDYSFVFPVSSDPPSVEVSTPYDYIGYFQDWKNNKTVLKFVIPSNNVVNVPVLLEEISYGEKDASGDVYYTLSLREYRQLKLNASIDTQAANEVRSVENAPKPPQEYTVVSGDTLWAIAKKYYGNGSLYPKIAEANGLKNPHLIYPGDVFIIPGGD